MNFCKEFTEENTLPRLDIQSFTPAIQQYLKARQKLGENSVLLFRMGDFYEAFFEDAKLIAKELEITLTGKAESSYPGGKIPMAGVPAKAVTSYVARLLERNYKVHIAEQMADPKTCKGLVPREVTQILTPGTVNDLDLLSSYRNNFILALYPTSVQSRSHRKGFGLAYADISTGEFYLTELDQEYLDQELSRINPSELILPSTRKNKEAGEIEARLVPIFDAGFIKQKFFCSNYENKNFSEKQAIEKLGNNFGEFPVALKAAGALMEYLRETQPNLDLNKVFDRIRTYQVGEYMMLDTNSRRNLELVKTLSGSTSGTLLAAIDRTCSNSGKRRLRAWLEQPLLNLTVIERRQNSIEEFIHERSVLSTIRNLLKEVYDMDRLSNRLSGEIINARELVALKNSLLQVVQIAACVIDCKSHYLSSLQNIPVEILDVIREIEFALVESPPLTITEGQIIRKGFNQELDDYISLVEDSETWLRDFEENEKNKLNIKLKVGFNKIHGYFIETSRLNQSKMPEEYICKQTMVGAARYITPELKEFEEKINNAETRRNALEHKLFVDLRRRLASKASLIRELADDTANLDAVQSLATTAIEWNYCRPRLDNSRDLLIRNGRHPVIEQKLDLGAFVANDFCVDKSLQEKSKIMILTGPNMAGKSTFMRQNALIILLAQIGSYVPAETAHIGLVDRIFTRIGASDDLASGQSTFMVEMNEMATILNGMTEKSFIVLDEVGRGTSTYDGVAIAWSILEYMCKQGKPRSVFATHYHELANLEKIYPEDIKNYQMLVVENKDNTGKLQIEFLHKVAEGSADKSYGIEVARLAGLPKEVLSRAKSINTQLQMAKADNLNKLNRKEIIANMDFNKLPLFKACE